jgi:hypothetical protein
MKKMIFTLALVASFVSFGQNNFKLGSHTKIINKNIEFKYKNPLSPFQKAEESYSAQGNINLVTAFYARTSDNIVALQIYATTIPPKYKNLDWRLMINSEQHSRKFIDSFLGASKSTAMNVSDIRVINMNGKVFLEVQSTLTASGVTQKQINWITLHKNTFVNILGATLINSFDENLSFFNEFSNSVILN